MSGSPAIPKGGRRRAGQSFSAQKRCRAWSRCRWRRRAVNHDPLREFGGTIANYKVPKLRDRCGGCHKEGGRVSDDRHAARLRDPKTSDYWNLHHVQEESDGDRRGKRAEHHQGGNGVIAIPTTANIEAITISATDDAASHRLGFQVFVPRRRSPMDLTLAHPRPAAAGAKPRACEWADD
jgi:hypothetical protein